MKTLVWDLPTRFFHWAFAGSITAAFVIALAVDDDSPVFQFHMLFGLIAAFLLVFRLVLGICGSRHARFSRFPLKPLETIAYFKGVLTGTAKKYPGVNPGSAFAAIAMFVLVPIVVFSGIGLGGKPFEEVHEVAAYALLAVIGAHLLGLVLHTLRHRENIAASMITGKRDVPAEEGIRSAQPLWGFLFAGAAAAWIVALFSNHDSVASTVRLPGTSTVLKLGENEGAEKDGGEHHQRDKHSRHREHDDD